MQRIVRESECNMTLRQGCEAYQQDWVARNLTDGTIRHWHQVAINLFHYLPENMPIKNFKLHVYNEYVLRLKSNEKVKEQSLYSYCRDAKTLLYFWLRKGWLEEYKVCLPKVGKIVVEPYTAGGADKILEGS